MNFKINPSAYGDVFVLPKAVVNNNLRLAGAIQLKALLYLYCNSGTKDTSCEAIAEALGADKGDVSDAMIFWCERGLVIKDGEEPAAVPVTLAPTNDEFSVSVSLLKEEKPVTPAKKKVADLPISRPSHELIAVRCN